MPTTAQQQLNPSSRCQAAHGKHRHSQELRQAAGPAELINPCCSRSELLTDCCDRLDASSQHLIDEVVVEGHTPGVDRTACLATWDDARPRQREPGAGKHMCVQDELLFAHFFLAAHPWG